MPKIDNILFAASVEDNTPCPFSFIDQFDKWFEFQKLVHFDGKSRYVALILMTSHSLSRYTLYYPFPHAKFMARHEEMLQKIGLALGVPVSKFQSRIPSFYKERLESLYRHICAGTICFEFDRFECRSPIKMDLSQSIAFLMTDVD